MAENQVPIEFEPNLKVANDALLNAVLTNVASFSNNVSELIENLVNFFTLTKFYLQALKDPIASVLIPALDALINALEDLKNIGFGSLSVWPWEVGRLESGVDTTRVEQALTALAASLGDVDPKNVKYDPKSKQFVVEVEEDESQTTFDFSPFGNISATYETNVRPVSATDGEYLFIDRNKVLNALQQAQNFLNPSQWDYGDSEIGNAIQKLNESFKFRTLTPSQFVSEVNSSFDDTNDALRPVGTGSYTAFVAFFALPTHHALRDLTQVLMNFFANFLENLPDLNDDRIERIELGDPLVVKGLENALALQTGEALDYVQSEIDIAEFDEMNSINDELKATDETAGVDRVSLQKIGDAINQIIADQNTLVEVNNELAKSQTEIKNIDKEISRIQLTAPTSALQLLNQRKTEQQENIRKNQRTRSIARSNIRNNTNTVNALRGLLTKNEGERYNLSVQTFNLKRKKLELEKELENIQTNGIKLEDKIYGFKDTVKRHLPASLSGTYEANEENDYKPTIRLNTGSDLYSSIETITIPMFRPGSLIQQGTVFNDFTAEVVEHEPIVIKNGRVIKNTVRIKSKRGSLKENTSESETPNSPPVIELNPKGIPKEDGSLDTFGILKTGRGFDGTRALLNYPMFTAKIATAPKEVVTGTGFTASIYSNSNTLLDVLPAPDKGPDPILKRIDLNENIFSNKTLANNIKFRSDMVKFVQGFSIGQPIQHEYINPPLYSEIQNEPTNDENIGFLKNLWDVLPGQGYTPVIKRVRIGLQDVNPVEIEDQLFRKKTLANEKVIYEGMNSIRIDIGRQVKSGAVEDYASNLIKVPDGFKRAWDPEISGKNFKTFNLQGSTSDLPNWKFKRINDFFPVYGETIDSIISKIEFAKDFAKGALKKLDEAIAYLENLIEDLIELNQAIQRLLQFFTTGLDKAGFYSAKISGDGGISEFKEKLSNAKIKSVNKNPTPEFQLKPVTTIVEVKNPITGDIENVESTTLKMVKEVESEEEFRERNPDGTETELLSFSDLNNLKYSGGFVLFGMGTNAQYLDKFLKLSGIKKREEIENASVSIPISELDSLLDFCKPFVKEIQIQKINSNTFIASESSTSVKKDTGIKIIFDNESDQLTDEQKQKIKDVRGDDFEFNPNIQYGSVMPNTTNKANSAGNVILSTDNFETSVPLNFTVEPIKSNVESEIVDSVILRTKSNLESLTNFKIKVSKTILSSDNITLKDEFISNGGFTTASTSVLNINFE